jgi:hypothetical protein
MSRDGMLCDQPTAGTASIFNYTVQGLTFQGRPVVADGSSWWLYMGASGAKQQPCACTSGPRARDRRWTG